MMNVVLAVLAVATTRVCVPPALESIRLPGAVEIEATGYNNGSPAPFERFRAKVGDNWSTGVQEVFQGDLGFIPRTSVFGKDDFSLRVEVPRSVGTKSDSFAQSRMTILDPYVSPKCWIRLADLAESRGPIPWKVVGDSITSSFQVDLREYGRQFVDIEWSGSQEVLMVKSGRSAQNRTEYRYAAWKALSGGSRHPTNIEISFGHEPDSIRKTIIVDVLRLADPQPPEPPRFGPSFAVHDEQTGATLDGDLKLVASGGLPRTSSAALTEPPRRQGVLPWAIATTVLAVMIVVYLAIRWFRR